MRGGPVRATLQAIRTGGVSHAALATPDRHRRRDIGRRARLCRGGAVRLVGTHHRPALHRADRRDCNPRRRRVGRRGTAPRNRARMHERLPWQARPGRRVLRPAGDRPSRRAQPDDGRAPLFGRRVGGNPAQRAAPRRNQRLRDAVGVLRLADGRGHRPHRGVPAHAGAARRPHHRPVARTHRPARHRRRQVQDGRPDDRREARTAGFAHRRRRARPLPGAHRLRRLPRRDLAGRLEPGLHFAGPAGRGRVFRRRLRAPAAHRDCDGRPQTRGHARRGARTTCRT